MKRQTMITLVIAAVLAVVVAGVVIVERRNAPEPVTGSEASQYVLRDDSHRLDVAEDGEVTLVEFMDFECEACGGMYPFIEQVREQYRGKITFVARYFPLPGHANGMNAARAVQAAAEQGKFEDMYNRMFETQKEWGESQESKAALFRTYAEELGLDMTRYDADVASDATGERIEADIADGKRLGVTSTPTFFLNGEMMELTSPDAFVADIDAALAD